MLLTISLCFPKGSGDRVWDASAENAQVRSRRHGDVVNGPLLTPRSVKKKSLYTVNPSRAISEKNVRCFTQLIEVSIMPLLTLRLLRLRSSAERFAQLLFKEPGVQIVVASKPRYLVVRPTKNDVPSLAGVDYDLMLLLRTENESIPSSLRSIIQQEYKIIVGIPSKLLSAYPQRNRKLLEQAPYAKLTGSLDNPHVPESSQNLELSPNLLRFMK